MKNYGKVRFAEPSDIDDIIEMCALHAAFEQTGFDRTDKKVRLSKDMFSGEPKLYCLVVEGDEQLIGYATYMKQYATWEAEEYIYMDCLFVREFARGLRIGEKIISKIQEESMKRGCRSIQWQTPNFNMRAMKFYRRIGASSKPKERFFLKI